MALTCWLPLLGTTENQGCGSITATNNGAVIDNNGKIGKCYSFNGNDYYIALAGQKLFDCFKGGTTAFSICMWVYHADTRRAILFGDYGLSNSIGFNIELNTGHGLRFYWNGSPDYSPGLNVGLNTWSHIALTYDGTSLKSYLNGNLVATRDGTLATRSKTIGEFRLGRDSRTTDTALNGKLNDIRVYGDHCLSAAEVHEIAQGLVLHYKLDSFQGGYGNPNLLPASDTTHFNTTRSFEFQGWVNNFYTTSWVNEHLTVGQQYTLSYTVTCISIPDTSIYSVSETRYSPILVHQGSGWSQVTTTNDGIKSTNLLPGQSRTYKCTFTFATATESPAYYGFCGYTCLYRNADRTSAAYARFRIDNLKLELGSDATSWVPNIDDENVDATHIQDSSGYNHNGTITGNPSIISNTPRYSFGIHLGKTRINSSTGFPSGDNPNFTIAFWTKIFSNITYVSYGDLCGMYDTGQGGNTFRLELCGSPPGNNLMWFRGPSGQNGGGFNMNSSSSSGWFSKDVWHHAALVGDGVNKKYYCYLDGQLCQTYNGSANSWTPTGQVYLGDTIEATADFSDFRIYCTPLLDTDIKQLYNVGMKVDNLGGVHGFELEESGSRELIAGHPLNSSFGIRNEDRDWYNGYVNGEIYLNSNMTSVGTGYIPVFPTGKTYYYDIDYSANAGNQLYIQVERYDANKTTRTNQGAITILSTKPSFDVSHKHIFGTVDLSTDTVNPCAFICLRILNGWSGTASGVTGISTIHNISIKEVSSFQNPKVHKNGILLLDELKEYQKASFYKNGYIEASTFIEM